jgi:hypothetical protein
MFLLEYSREKGDGEKRLMLVVAGLVRREGGRGTATGSDEKEK